MIVSLAPFGVRLRIRHMCVILCASILPLISAQNLAALTGGFVRLDDHTPALRSERALFAELRRIGWSVVFDRLQFAYSDDVSERRELLCVAIRRRLVATADITTLILEYFVLETPVRSVSHPLILLTVAPGFAVPAPCDLSGPPLSVASCAPHSRLTPSRHPLPRVTTTAGWSIFPCGSEATMVIFFPVITGRSGIDGSPGNRMFVSIVP